MGHFSKSCRAQEMLKEYHDKLYPDTQALQLIQRVDTRWNSEFDMFERVLRERLAIDAVITAKHISPELSRTDWEMIESFVKVFRPIKDATVLMSAEKYPTASRFIPILQVVCTSLLDPVDNQTHFEREMSLELANDILVR